MVWFSNKRLMKIKSKKLNKSKRICESESAFSLVKMSLCLCTSKIEETRKRSGASISIVCCVFLLIYEVHVAGESSISKCFAFSHKGLKKQMGSALGLRFNTQI